MEKFNFYQDRKVTCWERTHFEVTAETYEEAFAIVQSWQGEDVMEWEDEEKVIITDARPSMKRVNLYPRKKTTGKPPLKYLR